MIARSQRPSPCASRARGRLSLSITSAPWIVQESIRPHWRATENRDAPAGAVVPGLQVVDAVSKGVLDGGHGIPAFWFGKNIAFGLYGAGPDFGMDANQLMGWVEYGGGGTLPRFNGQRNSTS